MATQYECYEMEAGMEVIGLQGEWPCPQPRRELQDGPRGRDGAHLTHGAPWSRLACSPQQAEVKGH